MTNKYLQILARETSLKKNTLWFGLGNTIYAFSSIFLMLFVTRTLNDDMAGIFSIGWAMCQQMLSIGNFASRNYQSVDVIGEFKAKTYFNSKFITISLMFIGIFIYGFLLSLSSLKLTIAVLLTLFVSAEVWADVFAGFFQQHERLDISGKSYFFRVLAYICGFALSLLITKNLELAILVATIISYSWIFLVDYQFVKLIGYDRKFKPTMKDFLALFKQTLPVFISAFTIIYMTNTPKNSIELYLTDDLQAAYNIISMPSAIIMVLTSVILTPIYTTISRKWTEKNLAEFLKIIFKISTIIVSLTTLILLAGYFLGIPVLSIVYGIDLAPYKSAFMILLVAGGLNTFVYFTTFLLTVFRKQYALIYVYLIVVILATIYTNYLVKNFQLLGAGLSYFTSIFLLVLMISSLCFIFYKKQTKKLG
ncbi:hypothetical protein OZX68_01350 [Streptococcaceae bacterium ESL0729]|nr:hypothetical protein OZX68_01350 [Streptococcaceae bacterium ESL0729]